MRSGRSVPDHAVNHKESNIDMPEPQANPDPIFANVSPLSDIGFPRLLVETLRSGGSDTQGRHGRLIWIDSVTLRRKVRRFASARTSVTDSDLLFVGLAYDPRDPSGTVPTAEERTDPVHLARVVRTLTDPQQAHSRATVQATRLLATVEQAVRSQGGTVDWILEGTDRPAIEALLAVPGDHRFVGMIAAKGVKCRAEQAAPVIAGEAPVDLDGFGGGFPAVRPHTGGGSGGVL